MTDEEKSSTHTCDIFSLCFEIEGELWIKEHSRSPEYFHQEVKYRINFCPWCGKESKSRIFYK